MGILFLDGFDWWDDEDDAYTWNNTAGNPYVLTDNPRLNPPSTQKVLANNNNQNAYLISRFLDPDNGFRNEIIAGWMMKIKHRGETWYGMGMTHDGGGYQVALTIPFDLSIELWRGNKSALLWRSNPGAIHPYVYNHIEWRVLCDNTSGEMELRVNGEQLVNLTNVDTQAQSNSSLNRFIIGHAATNWHYWDDLYILDKLGGVNDDFIGPAPYINSIWPDASGEHTEWLASAGDNWDCVDDAGDIDTADYTMVSGDYLIDGAQDSYVFTDVENWSDTIYGVSFSNMGRSFDTSGEALALMNISGEGQWTNSGENVMEPWRAEGANASRYKYIWNKNPSGEVSWTEADLNRSEFGVEYKA